MRYFILLATLTLSQLGNAQQYMDEITRKTCECAEKTINDASKDAETRQMELGFCIISEAAPYKKELKRDYNIDFNKMNESTGEELGQLIGVRMAGVCPNTILKLYGELNSDSPTDAAVFSNTNELEVEGSVRRVEEGQFYTITLERADGSTVKLIWLTEAKIPAEYVENPQRLLGKTVEISYTQQLLFDGRIKEYNQFNVITKIEF